jgi:hypothetical protein
MVHGGFAWRAGFPTRADANLFAEQLAALRAEDGTVAVDDVLEAQRPEGAPLHDEIEWDDLAAAHKWRLQHVHQALGALRVIPIDVVREEPMPPIRAMVPARTVDRENGAPNSYVFSVTTAAPESVEVISMRARQQSIGDIRKLAQRIVTLPGCQDIAEQLIELCDLL